MAKPVISPEEFTAEVNKRLPAHDAYQDGLHVFLVPKGANGRQASGYDWEPKSAATAGVVAAVAQLVESEFEVNPYITHVGNG